MMQKMLADRFELTVHRSEKSFSVYGLVAAKNGIKFKEVPDTGSNNSSSSGTKYTGTCVNMENLAAFLSRRVELPVLDMTGLKGYYDLKMEWAEEPKTKDGAPADPPNGPALTTALQEQLGLKLEPRKVPLDLLIVDHAEKMPTEN